MKPFPLPCIFLILAACSPTIQNTSGEDYINARPGTIDAEIAQIAAVEPDLRFPARIGIARVVNGRLSSFTGYEADQFGDFISRNPDYGEFVPISPIVAEMVGSGTHKPSSISIIRRAAARQHLDYILLYEIGARSRIRNTPFALADVTIIGGAFLPTRNIRVAGIGQAAFIDVRNGYPYGTTTVTEDLSGLARSFFGNQRSKILRDKAELAVTKKLIPDIEKMLKMLKAEAARS